MKKLIQSLKLRVYRFIVISFIVLINQVITLYASGSGTEAAQFLQFGIGARAVAMGEAYSAITDDIYSIYWNPAGLISIDNKEVSLAHSEWIEGIKHEFLAYAQRFTFGTLGFSFNYLTYGDIKGTKENPSTGEYLEGQDYKFTASDLAISISYAREIKISEYDIRAGLNLKMIQQENESERSNSSFAGDIGLQYRLPDEDSLLPDKIAFSGHNFGSGIKFVEKEFPLPLYFRLGAGYEILDKTCNLGLDINIPTDDNVWIGIGGEYLTSDLLAIRAGYKIGQNNLGSLSGLTVGIGVKRNKFSVDYAFASYGELGNTHRVSLTLKF